MLYLCCKNTTRRIDQKYQICYTGSMIKSHSKIPGIFHNFTTFVLVRSAGFLLVFVVFVHILVDQKSLFGYNVLTLTLQEQ